MAYTEVASLSFLLTLIVRQGAFVSADRAARNRLSAITIKQEPKALGLSSSLLPLVATSRVSGVCVI